MSTAETTRNETRPEEDDAQRARLQPQSPGLAAGWLLRTAAFTAVLAGATALIVAPGLHSNAPGRIVDVADGAAAILAYFLGAMLFSLVLWGALELVRARTPFVPRVALVAAGAAVVALAAFGLRDRLVPAFGVLLAAFTTVAAIAGATTAARTP
ncbi:MAG TPA: hypothetical protein VIY73_20970, partial [Polyangiaceae bacterium]